MDRVRWRSGQPRSAENIWIARDHFRRRHSVALEFERMGMEPRRGRCGRSCVSGLRIELGFHRSWQSCGGNCSGIGRNDSRRALKALSATADGQQGHATHMIRVVKSILVNRPVEDVYRFWRGVERFPSFMKHLESVQVRDERHSHWKAKGPAGSTIEWDAEIMEDVPDSVIRWRSVQGSDIDHAGCVRFERAPGGRGTFVLVDIRY